MTNEQALREALEPCPFCGEAPAIMPADPLTEGDDWNQLVCENEDCPVLSVGLPVYGKSPSERFTEMMAAWNTRQALSRPAMSEEDARELLAREYARENMHVQDMHVQNSPDLGDGYFARRDKAAIAAIRAASERKEG